MSPISRRHRADMWIPAEIKIRAATQDVQHMIAMCPDVQLGDALALLRVAQEMVADHVDGVSSRVQVTRTVT